MAAAAMLQRAMAQTSAQPVGASWATRSVVFLNLERSQHEEIAHHAVRVAGLDWTVMMVLSSMRVQPDPDVNER